jgi:hypothetical protein
VPPPAPPIQSYVRVATEKVERYLTTCRCSRGGVREGEGQDAHTSDVRSVKSRGFGVRQTFATFFCLFFFALGAARDGPNDDAKTKTIR